MKKENKYFSEIMKGLQDIREYESGRKKLRTRNVSISPVEEMKPREVVKLRESLMLSQNLFAELLGVSKKTLEAWEYGKNEPSGASLRMLNLIKVDPELIYKYHLVQINA